MKVDNPPFLTISVPTVPMIKRAFDKTVTQPKNEIFVLSSGELRIKSSRKYNSARKRTNDLNFLKTNRDIPASGDTMITNESFVTDRVKVDKES